MYYTFVASGAELKQQSSPASRVLRELAGSPQKPAAAGSFLQRHPLCAGAGAHPGNGLRQQRLLEGKSLRGAGERLCVVLERSAKVLPQPGIPGEQREVDSISILAFCSFKKNHFQCFAHFGYNYTFHGFEEIARVHFRPAKFSLQLFHRFTDNFTGPLATCAIQEIELENYNHIRQFSLILVVIFNKYFMYGASGWSDSA